MQHHESQGNGNTTVHSLLSSKDQIEVSCLDAAQARLAVAMLSPNDKLEGNLEVDLRGGAQEILEGGIERKRNGGKMGAVEVDGWK